MTKRTIIYVDGYNFYYSRLKDTAFKWLDIARLFRDTILKQQDPSAEVVVIKYFTAAVMSYARHGITSVHAKTQYLRAAIFEQTTYREGALGTALHSGRRIG